MSNDGGINKSVIPSTINMFRGRQRLVMTCVVPHAGPSPFDNIDKCFDTIGMGTVSSSFHESSQYDTGSTRKTCSVLPLPARVCPQIHLDRKPT